LLSNNIKYYLRPFGFIPPKDLYLQKKKVIEVKGNYYSDIEIIKKENRKISKISFLAEDFYKFANKNKQLQNQFNALTKKINNQIFKKKNLSFFQYLIQRLIVFLTVGRI